MSDKRQPGTAEDDDSDPAGETMDESGVTEQEADKDTVRPLPVPKPA